MTKRSSALKRAGTFAAGVLIGLLIVTPVFAATLGAESLPPYLLLGSLIVLLVGLVLKAVTMSRSQTRGHRNRWDSTSPNAGDLRWSEFDHSADVTLPGHPVR